MDEWLDSLFDDLLFELELEEAEGWVNGLALFKDAEPLKEEGGPKSPS